MPSPVRSTELGLDPGDRHFLQTGEALPADRLADILLERLATWSGQAAGSALQDDVTVMVVDRSRVES